VRHFFFSQLSLYLILSQSTTGAGTTTGTGTASTALPSGTSTTKLNTAAKALGWKYFGSATDNPEFTDTAYVKQLNDSAMFGQITPGNSMKWVRSYSTVVETGTQLELIDFLFWIRMRRSLPKELSRSPLLMRLLTRPWRITNWFEVGVLWRCVNAKLN
jgi:hypothetical protein